MSQKPSSFLAKRPLRIGVIGASGRAIAQSLKHAGYQPSVADIFTDLDTQQVAQACVLPKYPWSALAWLQKASIDAWCYTGGIENYPRLIGRLAQITPLLGCNPEVLRKIRNPFWLQKLAREHDFKFPMVRRLDEFPPKPQTHRWLTKPFRSAGGLNVDILKQTENNSSKVYAQSRVEGTLMSAAVLSNSTDSQILGVSRLQVGAKFGAPSPFQFVGAITDLHFEMEEAPMLRRMVDAIHQQGKPVGLWGIDFIMNNEPWLIEVNPRWTASMALWERCNNGSLMDAHIRAIANGTLPVEPPNARDRHQGMRVLYAKRSFQVTPEFQAWLLSPPATIGPQYADVPLIGTAINYGDPICTVYVTGENYADVEQMLSQCQERVQTRVAKSTPWPSPP